MVPLGAEILTERLSGDDRGAVRRTLSLGVHTHSAGEVAMALILNISETGLLLETVLQLEVGEKLRVDIPEARASSVRVVWTDGLLAGCEFVVPVSSGAVSAARLKATGEPGANRRSPADESKPQPGSGNYERDDRSFERTIVLISGLISLVAIIIFLAAILPL
jgi:hypothetical protein